MNWVATVLIHCAGLRSIAPADVRRDEVQRTAFSFFSPPIFSALRSASRAAIPPTASAVTLQHSRSSVCSIHRAGQRRLEKAADALKVSWGLPPRGISRPRHLEAAAGQAGHGEKPQDGVQPRAIPSNNSAILVKRGVAPTDRVTKDTMRSRERVSSGANFIFAFSDAMG